MSSVPRSLAAGLAAAACLLLVQPRDAAAWGADGHRIVCRIAYQFLEAPVQREVTRLVAAYRTPAGTAIGGFPNGCVFADEARTRARDGTPGWSRFAAYDEWHFLNVPRATLRVSEAHCAGGCVLSAIAHHRDALRSAPTDEARAEALLLLAHWVADIHQPLHVSFADDLGGNRTGPIDGGVYTATNLHAVWDAGILTRARGRDDWQAYADRIARGITPAERAAWAADPPLAWAQESYLLTTAADMRYCEWRGTGAQSTCAAIPGGRTLTLAYQDTFAPIVARRLQQAAVRLADLIARHLRLS